MSAPGDAAAPTFAPSGGDSGAPMPLDWPHVAAAAVLVHVAVDELRPLAETGATPPPELPRVVWEEVFDANGETRFALHAEVRRLALGWLRDNGLVAAALFENHPGPDAPGQRLLEGHLRGAPVPLAEQSAEELRASLEVLDWIRDVVDGLPERDAIRKRLALEEALSPLRARARHFAGRADELEILRRHVGARRLSHGQSVFSPAPITRYKDAPPLLFWGVGGMGKSTLLARFLLEHADVPDPERVPFAYVDLDRPGIDPSRPATLLSRIAGELGRVLPIAEGDLTAFRRALHAAIDEESGGDRTSPPDALTFGASPRKAELTHLERLRDLVAPHVSAIAPLIVVIDTLEETQYLPPDGAARFWAFVRACLKVLPSLRLVMAGRNDVPAPDISRRELAQLDIDAAVALLAGRGISDPSLARRIFFRVTGNPLCLWLAAELVKREGKLSLDGPALDAALIQGVLYKRILGHVQDLDVRRLAHPGLVLRWVTPELIRDVLAGPCGVDVPDDERAGVLFEQMGREAHLVTRERSALRHRSDVRKQMLHLIRESEPEKAQEIHRRAADYHARRASTEDELEALYHALCVTPADERRWEASWRPALAMKLLGAEDELPVEARNWLATRRERALFDPGAATEWPRMRSGSEHRALLDGTLTRGLDDTQRGSPEAYPRGADDRTLGLGLPVGIVELAASGAEPVHLSLIHAPADAPGRDALLRALSPWIQSRLLIVDDPASVVAGVSAEAERRRQIARADLVVLLVSEAFHRDVRVKGELFAVAARSWSARVPIVPIRVDDAHLPSSLPLEPALPRAGTAAAIEDVWAEIGDELSGRVHDLARRQSDAIASHRSAFRRFTSADPRNIGLADDGEIELAAALETGTVDFQVRRGALVCVLRWPAVHERLARAFERTMLATTPFASVSEFKERVRVVGLLVCRIEVEPEGSVAPGASPGRLAPSGSRGGSPASLGLGVLVADRLVLTTWDVARGISGLNARCMFRAMGRTESIDRLDGSVTARGPRLAEVTRVVESSGPLNLAVLALAEAVGEDASDSEIRGFSDPEIRGHLEVEALPGVPGEALLFGDPAWDAGVTPVRVRPTLDPETGEASHRVDARSAVTCAGSPLWTLSGQMMGLFVTGDEATGTLCPAGSGAALGWIREALARNVDVAGAVHVFEGRIPGTPVRVGSPRGPGLTIDGRGRQRIAEALTDAFSTRDDLERMMVLELGERLDTVTHRSSVSRQAYEIVEWADVQGRLDDLLVAAVRQRPGNRALQGCLKELISSSETAPREGLATLSEEMGLYRTR